MTSTPGCPDLITCNAELRLHFLTGTAGQVLRHDAVHCASASIAASHQQHCCGRAGPPSSDSISNSTLTADKMRLYPTLVPLKNMCSRKCAQPLFLSFSKRLPASIQIPTHAVSANGVVSDATRIPFDRLVTCRGSSGDAAAQNSTLVLIGKACRGLPESACDPHVHKSGHALQQGTSAAQPLPFL